MDVPNYWQLFQYIPPGDPAKKAVHNTCELKLPKRDQCSGNGECKPWNPGMKIVNGEPMMFCQCYRDWADPECRTQRKSQRIAYFLSIFGGYLGLDHFYLGTYYSGFAKCATLGLGGLWYVYDVVRIGSSPIYASEFRVAYDLPHWFFVFFTVLFFSGLGYFLSGGVAVAIKREKENKKLMVQAEEEFLLTKGAAAHIKPEDTVGQATFASFGIPLPAHIDNFSLGGRYGTIPVPYQVTAPGRDNLYSSWGVWKHAMKGFRSEPQHDGRGRFHNFT
jgi:hypothetical protein